MFFNLKNISWFFNFSGFTLYPFIFNVNGKIDIDHELVHLKQQHIFYRYGWYFGILVWLFLYFCVLPYKWHPFRTRWEMEAYMKGSGYTKEQAEKIIRDYYF